MYGNSGTDHKLMMFWLKSDATLRDFKLAIGSKIVFKYRLQFYTSLEQYYECENKKAEVGFSTDEQDMVLKMVTWEIDHSKVRQTNHIATIPFKVDENPVI
jgi:hypothetical protein